MPCIIINIMTIKRGTIYIHQGKLGCLFVCWGLTPLSTIFQLYRGSHQGKTTLVTFLI